MDQGSIKYRLRELMLKGGISEADVSRKTGIPQATINKILNSDKVVHPTSLTLMKLAKYFSVTIDYLVGLNGLSTETHISGQKSCIPIIEWDWIKEYQLQRTNALPSNHRDWIMVSDDISVDAFGLNSLPNFEPFFPENSILIIDRQDAYDIGQYVLVSIDFKKPTIRKIAEESGDKYLVALSVKIPSEKMTDKTFIYGKVVEVRLRY